MKRVIDEFDNELRVVNNRISLKFKDEKYPRGVGVINERNGFLFISRIRAKHLHKKMNGYGFNHMILKQATKFDKIKLSDDFGTYLIPISVILEQGKFLHFKKQGFELQIFLHLDVMRKYNMYKNEDNNIVPKV